MPLSGAAVAVGLAGFAAVVRELWSHFDGDQAFVTALLLLGVFLLATTARLLLRRASLEPLYLAHVVLLTSTGLSWFLVPVLGRTGGRSDAASTSERVVGTGPGRFEVELAEGERLVVQSGRS